MGSETSERMMALLAELSALKEVERADKAQPVDDESRRLEGRREEIKREIQRLADQKTNAVATQPSE